MLILDEPTDGLDPNQKHEVRALIRKMGEKKAIIFSTHILRRWMRYVRGPSSLTAARLWPTGHRNSCAGNPNAAGAVNMRVSGATGAAVSQRLSQLPMVKKTVILEDKANGVLARVFPKAEANGALAQSVADAARGWRVLELRTEEGRLDDVFRSITMPDTAKEEKK